MSIRAGSKLGLLAALLLAPVAARAGQLSGPEQGVVPFGMGRAYSAIADDSLALYYNPAGLAMVSRVDIQVFDVKLESNTDVLKTYSSLTSLGKTAGGSLASSLSSLAGKHIMASGSNVTQVTLPHFAFGVVYDTHTDFDMENLSYPTTEMRYTSDLSLVMGGALAWGKRKDLRFGVAGRWQRRQGGEKSVPISKIMGSKAAIKDLFGQSGTGLGADLGMQYMLPTPGRVEYTTSLVWHDVGQTSFGGPQAKDAPTKIDQNIVAGLGVRFPIGGKKNRRLERRYGPSRSTSAFSLAFDYDHLNYRWGREPLAKHSHVGANLDLPVLSLQLGLNQTSLTFGAACDVGIFRVAFATYAEELGSYAGQRTDRRFMLSIGSGIGFSATK